jgi:hypothetical protein
VVRFHFIFSAAIAFVAATMLTKCANSSVVWEHYDQCVLEIHHSLQWRNVGDGSV